MAVRYPDVFQCAQITPYRIAVDMGVLRTPMEGGYQRQRRLYRTMPHAFALEFVMTVQELGPWQEWVNVNAYDYFEMPKLESMYSGLVGEIASPHSIRFTGNLEIDNPVYGWVRVKVGAELDPLQDVQSGPIAPSNAWFVGGSASAPSDGSLLHAGVPSNVAGDRINAGSPGRPAAVYP
jgi:hypothetical protein